MHVMPLDVNHRFEPTFRSRATAKLQPVSSRKTMDLRELIHLEQIASFSPDLVPSHAYSIDRWRAEVYLGASDDADLFTGPQKSNYARDAMPDKTDQLPLGLASLVPPLYSPLPVGPEAPPSISGSSVSTTSSFSLPKAAEPPIPVEQQLLILQKMREDLAGIDIGQLKGPLKAVADQAFQRKPSALAEHARTTVSPQEAFLDYDEVSHQQQPQAMFPPIGGFQAAASLLDRAAQVASGSLTPAPPIKFRSASVDPPSPQSSFRFDFPRNAVRWDQPTTRKDRVRIRRQSTGGFSDDWLSPSSVSVSEDEPSPSTPPPIEQIPSMSIAMQNRKGRQAQPPLPHLDATGNIAMPFLNRAAEESYFSNRGTMPPESVASSDSASVGLSPRDFKDFPSSSASERSSSLSSSGSGDSLAGRRGLGAIWLSGPPPRAPTPLQPSSRSQPAVIQRTDSPLPFDMQTAPTLPEVIPDSFVRTPIKEDEGKHESDDDQHRFRQRAARSVTPKRKRAHAPEATVDTPRLPTASLPASRPTTPASARRRSPIKTEEEVKETSVSEEADEEYKDNGNESEEDYDPSVSPAMSTSAPPRRKKRRLPTPGSPDADATTAGSSTKGGSKSGGSIRCDFVDPTTNEKCGTIFRRPYDLARHKDTIHLKPSEKPTWTCKSCNHNFSRKDALLRHQRIRGHS